MCQKNLTIEGLKELLKDLKLAELVEQLDDRSFERWKNMTEAQWEKVAGVLAGIQIYNYLNPRREGNEKYSEAFFPGHRFNTMNENVQGYIKFFRLKKIPRGRLYQSEYPYYDGSDYYINNYGSIYRITFTNIYLASGYGGYYDKLVL